MQIISKNFKFLLVVVFVVSFVILKLDQALIPFFPAFIIAYLSRPIVDWLEKRKMKRSLAAFCVSFFLTGIFFVILFLSVPALIGRSLTFIKNIDISNFVSNLEEHLKSLSLNYFSDSGDVVINAINPVLSNILNALKDGSKKIGNNIIESVITFFSNSLMVVLIPIIAYYLIKDWQQMIRGFYNLIPTKNRRSVMLLVSKIDKNVFKYLKGQLKIFTSITLLHGIGFYIIGVKNYFFFAVVMGIGSFVPYLGFFLSAGIVFIVTFQQFSGSLLEIRNLSIEIMIVQALDTSIITPKIMGDSLNLNPMWIIFGVLAFSSLFGIFGAFFSLPMIVVTDVTSRYFFEIYKKSAFYKSKSS